MKFFLFSSSPIQQTFAAMTLCFCVSLQQQKKKIANTFFATSDFSSMLFFVNLLIVSKKVVQD